MYKTVPTQILCPDPVLPACPQVGLDPAAEGREGTRAAEHGGRTVISAELRGGQGSAAGSAVPARHSGHGLQLLHPTGRGEKPSPSPPRHPDPGGQDYLPEERCQDVWV